MYYKYILLFLIYPKHKAKDEQTSFFSLVGNQDVQGEQGWEAIIQFSGRERMCIVESY